MKIKNKLAIVLLGVIILLSIILRFVYRGGPPAPGYINFNGVIYPVLVAATPMEQFKGLSDRQNLGDFTGMYFSFNRIGVYTMVMRDMLFPLDMVWLNNERVVDVKENLVPEPGREENALTRHTGAGLAGAVLELQAGSVKKMGIKIGDKLLFCWVKNDCIK